MSCRKCSETRLAHVCCSSYASAKVSRSHGCHHATHRADQFYLRHSMFVLQRAIKAASTSLQMLCKPISPTAELAMDQHLVRRTAVCLFVPACSRQKLKLPNSCIFYCQICIAYCMQAVLHKSACQNRSFLCHDTTSQCHTVIYHQVNGISCYVSK